MNSGLGFFSTFFFSLSSGERWRQCFLRQRLFDQARSVCGSYDRSAKLERQGRRRSRGQKDRIVTRSCYFNISVIAHSIFYCWPIVYRPFQMSLFVPYYSTIIFAARKSSSIICPSLVRARLKEVERLRRTLEQTELGNDKKNNYGGGGALPPERSGFAEGDEKILGLSGTLFLAREYGTLRMRRGLLKG